MNVVYIPFALYLLFIDAAEEIQKDEILRITKANINVDRINISIFLLSSYGFIKP